MEYGERRLNSKEDIFDRRKCGNEEEDGKARRKI